MIRILRRLLLVGAPLALLALAACQQEEGKTCQTTSDCKDELVCCFDGTSSSSTLGTCLLESECTQDASP